MLQKEFYINYADLRTNKSELGEVFIVQIDKRRMDDVNRLQHIDVEVEADAGEEEEFYFDADKFINASVSIFSLFTILAVVIGFLYLYPSSIVVLIGSFIALLINRAVRLHDIRVKKYKKQ